MNLISKMLECLLVVSNVNKKLENVRSFTIKLEDGDEYIFERNSKGEWIV